MKNTLAVALTLISAPAFAQPAAQPEGTPAVITQDTTRPGAPVKGANSFTESQARSRISEAGFSNITGLALDQDGIWRGKATRHGTEHDVALDYQGNVFPK